MSIAANDIRKSEEFCRHVLRQASTSFALPFKTLPKRKRLAFEVIYAFMRLVDDASDDADDRDRPARMREWRDHLANAFDGKTDGHAILPAMAGIVREFAIPQRYLEELIDGTAMDLTIRRYATFDELYRYCYKVAGVVGLVSLRIFGLQHPSDPAWTKAEELAEACGLAFQLTNILRDVDEDAARDRIYLPAEDIARFGITEKDVLARRFDERFRDLFEFQAVRAESYYAKSAPLLDMLAPDARPCLWLMREVYHGILDRIIEMNYDVFAGRARVNNFKKLAIAARAYLKRFQA